VFGFDDRVISVDALRISATTPFLTLSLLIWASLIIDGGILLLLLLILLLLLLVEDLVQSPAEHPPKFGEMSD